MNEVKGRFDVRGRRFAVLAASFNEIVVRSLVEGALSALRSHGLTEDDMLLAWVPGAFELPVAAKRLATGGMFDAVICLGAVIRGETPHFEYVAGEAARGIQEVALETGVPVAFGVLTTENMGQALDRAGGKHGNKGWDAAMTAMQTVSALDQLPEKE
jgi:6,7-dimethyl-8-ribityllumazine synthase